MFGNAAAFNSNGALKWCATNRMPHIKVFLVVYKLSLLQYPLILLFYSDANKFDAALKENVLFLKAIRIISCFSKFQREI
jgi:hypothetical protein